MKFTVTEILVSYIKELRKEKKITVTAFSQKIGKSKSYVTKFDNCEFKTLTLEDFQTIFYALCDGSPSEAECIMDNYFLSLIKNEYIDKNIDLMVDVSNYSNLVKKLDIPKDLILKLNRMLESKNITVHEIIECANANEPVKNYSNFNLVDYNEYFPVPVSDTNEPMAIYIKIKLDEDYIQSILNRETVCSNYFTLLAFANAYYRLELKNSPENMSTDNINRMAGILAHNLLFNFQLYALEDYFNRKESDENIKNLTTNLGTVSHSIQSTLGSYMNLVSHIYNQNPIYTENKILKLRRNLEADAAFYFASLDLPFYKVKHLNTDTKKKLLREIDSLIDRYANDEEYQNQLELL